MDTVRIHSPQRRLLRSQWYPQSRGPTCARSCQHARLLPTSYRVPACGRGPMLQCVVPSAPRRATYSPAMQRSQAAVYSAQALCRARAAGQPQCSTDLQGEAPRPCMQSMVRAHEKGVCCARQQPRSCFILYPVGFKPLRWAYNHRQDAHGVKSGSAGTPFAQGTVAWVGAHPSPVWAACCGALRLRTMASTISAASHDDTRRQLGWPYSSERHLLHGWCGERCRTVGGWSRALRDAARGAWAAAGAADSHARPAPQLQSACASPAHTFRYATPLIRSTPCGA